MVKPIWYTLNEIFIYDILYFSSAVLLLLIIFTYCLLLL
jgi:hypothetical protein